MPWVVELMAPGFASDPQKWLVGRTLTHHFSVLLFISIVSFQSGILNSFGKFAGPAAAPVILNLTMIVAVFAFVPFGETPAHGISWGVTIAGLLEILWLHFFSGGLTSASNRSSTSAACCIMLKSKPCSNVLLPAFSEPASIRLTW